MKYTDMPIIGYIKYEGNNIPVEIRSGDHSPPHAHIELPDGTVGSFSLRTGEQIKWNVGGNDLTLIKRWIINHRGKTKRHWNKNNPDNRIGAMNYKRNKRNDDKTILNILLSLLRYLETEGT